MLPPEAYLRARQTARFHVQVEILETRLPVNYPGSARVLARVRSVFVGGPRIATGDDVRFEVSVVEHAREAPIGTVQWIHTSRVRKGRLLEAFLNGDPPGCEVALWQARPIEWLSAAPQMKLDELV